MAVEDKIRWNKKYQNNKIPDTPIKVISDYHSLAKGKKALDLACGMGRHSRYLASKGFEVDSLDISSVAISNLQNIRNINATEVDFDSYKLIKNRYDLIVCSYFLKRSLFEQMIDALSIGGVIIMETFVEHPDNEREPSNPNFRLKEGELESLFSKRCEIIYSKEFWDDDYLGYRTKKASIVVKT